MVKHLREEKFTAREPRRTAELDAEHLIEETDALAGRDRGELCSRLISLYEHLLKHRFVNMPEYFKG